MSQSREQFYERYTRSRYQVGLEAYQKALQDQGVKRPAKILDVGCGPGQWSIAASALYPGSTVYAIDTQQEFLEIARQYRESYRVQNCYFQKMSYRDLTNCFRAGSFDVILCNSVLQYINWQEAIAVFSGLLRDGGILLMFWNHGSGRYLKQLPAAVIKLKWQRLIFLLRMFTIGWVRDVWMGGEDREQFVVLARLQKVCGEYGIQLERVPNQPRLYYRDKFLWLDEVFSCKGIKRPKEADNL